MKTILTFALAILGSAAAMGADCFVEGAQWWSKEYGAPMPNTPLWERVVTLTGDTVIGEHDCMKMWIQELDLPTRSPSSIDGQTLATIIRVEKQANGDRIWFLPNEGATEWLLMYDFSLLPGESCTVWMVPGDFSTAGGSPYSKKMICREITTDEQGLQVMTMAEEETYVDPESWRSVQWIRGGGSLMGVLRNSTFSLDGSSSGQLITLTLPDGEVVYRNDALAEVQQVESTLPEPTRICTLQGVPVSAPTSGEIYIVNGKKVLIK